jgi:rare lipoprotein A
MKNILRGIGVIAILLAAFMLITSCAPKAQTRVTSDGAASHNFDSGKEPVAKSGYASDGETYGPDDDFDIDSRDVDAEPTVKASPKQQHKGFLLDDDAVSDEKPARTAKAPKNTSDEAVGVSAASDTYFQKGVASWYGREFHGRKTASGEKFNMNELTAAHKSLPLGSVILVKNLDNGKIVKVRVNDRGPYKGKRILDLSYAAAKRLDMLGEGEALVGIKVIGSASQAYSGDSSDLDEPAAGMSDDESAEPVVKNRTPAKKFSEGYALQTGAFLSKRNADKLKDHLSEVFPENDVTVFNDGDLYKVRVNGITSRNEAEKYKKILGKEDISAFTVRQE